MDKLKIGLRDGSFAHCGYSNNPLPPTQSFEKIEWDRSGDNEECIYTDVYINQCIGDIVWLIEPYELIPHVYEYVKFNHSKFKKIFTHDKDILNLPNAHLIPYGGCWLKNEDHHIYDKSKGVSIVCSAKRSMQGHNLRHACASLLDTESVFGRGYREIESKLESLKDYRFQVVVENSKKDFWFTEKLIDCLRTGTVPVYYGCPSIGKFFDIKGIIPFDSIDELREILPTLTIEKYSSVATSINRNFDAAEEYLLAERSIYKHFNE